MCGTEKGLAFSRGRLSGMAQLSGGEDLLLVFSVPFLSVSSEELFSKKPLVKNSLSCTQLHASWMIHRRQDDIPCQVRAKVWRSSSGSATFWLGISG